MRFARVFLAAPLALVACTDDALRPREPATSVVEFPLAAAERAALATAVEDALTRVLPSLPAEQQEHVRAPLQTLAAALASADAAWFGEAVHRFSDALSRLRVEPGEAAELSALALVLERALTAIGDTHAAESADHLLETGLSAGRGGTAEISAR
jgi:uncharacterized protein YukE